MDGKGPDSWSLLTSKPLLLTMSLAQLGGIDPLKLLPLTLNHSKVVLTLPQASGKVPDSLLLLRSRA
jgi:hypothetical protein